MDALIYPGSFDPITKGHLDIIQRSLKIANFVVIAILKNRAKTFLFSVEERVEMIKSVMKENGFFDYVKVVIFDGLTIKLCEKEGIYTLVRGLRAISDFEHETAMFLMNRYLEPKVETIFLMSSQEYSFISSSIVKEVAYYGGDISSHVPISIASCLEKKYFDKK